MTENTNPLQKYYRQPAIYITLPSRGQYYTQDVFLPSETGEIPVFPMTAKDELAFKTPDSMISGQSTVDVIQSCIPNIKNAWKLVNYDLDTVLIAIRIATYGETMDINYSLPVTNESVSHTVNLPALLEDLAKVQINDTAKTKSGFEIKLSPLTYQSLSQIQKATFEQRKIYAVVNNSALTDDEKSNQFAKSFRALNEINFQMLTESISQINTPDGTAVTDTAQIQEFINNAEAKLIDEIQSLLGEIRAQAQVKPLKMKATEEQIKNNVPATYEVPITFDNSNFFV